MVTTLVRVSSGKFRLVPNYVRIYKQTNNNQSVTNRKAFSIINCPPIIREEIKYSLSDHLDKDRVLRIRITLMQIRKRLFIKQIRIREQNSENVTKLTYLLISKRVKNGFLQCDYIKIIFVFVPLDP